MQPEYVGILLSDNTFRNIFKENKGSESLHNYEKAAEVYDLIPCFFRIQDLSLDTCMAAVLIPTPSGYVRSLIPIPQVIHNRAIHQDHHIHQIIDRLISSGIFIYNASTRYGKDVVHHMLLSEPFMQSSLPSTLPAKPAAIRSLLESHNDIVLKPCRGSVGIGIMRLRRHKSYDSFTYSRGAPSAKGWRTRRLPRGKLPALLLKRIRSLPFLAQQRIPLAEYAGRPYDIRVTVQRGLKGCWEVTGMFAKTSPARTFVSNIAQGGSAYPVHIVFSRSFPGISPDILIEKTAHFAVQTAAILSRHMPYSADFGLDVAITTEGELFFIEANGCDQRYGFKEAGMEPEWRETYRKPMAFARYLLNESRWPLEEPQVADIIKTAIP